MPLFSDDERAQVGTTYKQQGREQAVKMGLDFVSPRMNEMVTEVQKTITGKAVVVHCARGGMRSRSFAMLLEFFGYTVFLLDGGYKAFKKHIRDQAQKGYFIVLIGSKTGSGKTKILQSLAALGEQVIDLEKIAHHRGSAFGALGLPPQPSQEQFIVNCLTQLARLNPEHPVWVEHEACRLGTVSIPQELWLLMQDAPVAYIEVPYAYRIQHLMSEYGHFSPEELSLCIEKLHKQLGGADTQKVMKALELHDREAVVKILLEHYDRAYEHCMQRNTHNKFYPISLTGTDSVAHAHELISFLPSLQQAHVRTRQTSERI